MQQSNSADPRSGFYEARQTFHKITSKHSSLTHTQTMDRTHMGAEKKLLQNGKLRHWYNQWMAANTVARGKRSHAAVAERSNIPAGKLKIANSRRRQLLFLDVTFISWWSGG